jgi:hypothetical protein
MKKIMLLALIVLLIVALAGCLPDQRVNESDRRANFLVGIWHGWIAPFSLIIGIFRPGIRVYESFNTGWWYDFGFYIAVISGFGGVSLSRKKLRAVPPGTGRGPRERPVN